MIKKSKYQVIACYATGQTLSYNVEAFSRRSAVRKALLIENDEMAYAGRCRQAHHYEVQTKRLHEPECMVTVVEGWV